VLKHGQHAYCFQKVYVTLTVSPIVVKSNRVLHNVLNYTEPKALYYMSLNVKLWNSDSNEWRQDSVVHFCVCLGERERERGGQDNAIS